MYLKLLKDNDLPRHYRERHLAWVECALAQLLEKSSSQKICKYWSDASDRIIKGVWNDLKIPEERLTLFALGKWGACELNLSSDIDIIIVSQRPPGKEDYTYLRRFKSLLSDNTEYGFCYRIDLDLRPGGRLAPPIASINQFDDHYWSQGSTWEKIALLRLRPICGAPEIINAVKKTATSFSYRKFIDFGLIDHISQLRSLIHFQKDMPPKKHISLKFNEGGIRDIEFYINVLQLMHGGRIPDLRTYSTDLAITRLMEHNILEKEKLETLRSTYWKLRELENITQVIDDQQTHLWPPQNMAKAKIFSQTELKYLCLNTKNIVEAGILPPKQEIEQLPSVEKQEVWLKKLGFSENSIKKTWKDLIKTNIRSSSPQNGQQKFESFLMKFTIELYKHGVDRDLGLSLLAEFISAIRAKASFFNLLLRNEKLLNGLAVLFGTSPYLGGIIASRPALLDSFVLRLVEHDTTVLDILLEQLTEQKSLSEVINANQFLTKDDLSRLNESLTDTADDICNTLFEGLHNEYGPSSLEILCLGKWGGKELGLKSDLDFIFVTENTPLEIDHKIAKRFISRLGEQHSGGNIYNVDLRLRPSGKAGPLLCTIKQLKDYLQNKAAAWERQSYLKARWLKPTRPKLYDQLRLGQITEHDKNELKNIRTQLLNKEVTDSSIDIKFCRGGLIDIEFCAQISLLSSGLQPQGTSTAEHINTLKENIKGWEEKGDQLLKAYNSLRRIEQLHQISSSLSGTTIDFNKNFRLCALLKSTASVLHEKYKELLNENYETIKSLDPIYG